MGAQNRLAQRAWPSASGGDEGSSDLDARWPFSPMGGVKLGMGHSFQVAERGKAAFF